MAQFIDLFKGKLKFTDVFGLNFDQKAFFEFLKGIRDNPGEYLPDGTDAQVITDAGKVAGAFINDTDQSIKGIITVSPIGSPIILDLGSALGYLLDTQKPSSQSIETGYRPIFHVYGRFMNLCSSTMTVIMFDENTSRFHYGSTITRIDLKTENKEAVRLERFNRLKAAMGTIKVAFPALTPIATRALSADIAAIRVLGKANLKNTKRQKTKIDEKLLKLYDQWINTLVVSASGSKNMTVTFTTDIEALKRLHVLKDSIYSAEEPKYQPGVADALKVDDPSLKTYLEDLLGRGGLSEFGNCAETLPFINLINDVTDRKKCQGLAMKPDKMVSLDDAGIKTGTVIYNQKGVFRKPCQNCGFLVELLGMESDYYNTYLNTVVTTFDPTPT